MYIFACTKSYTKSDNLYFMYMYISYVHNNQNPSNKTTVAVNIHKHSISQSMCSKIYYLGY